MNNRQRDRSRRVDTGLKDSLGRTIYNWEPVKNVNSVIHDLDLKFIPVEDDKIVLKSGHYTLEEIYNNDNYLIQDPELNDVYKKAVNIHNSLYEYSNEKFSDKDYQKVYNRIMGNDPFETVENINSVLIPELKKRNGKKYWLYSDFLDATLAENSYNDEHYLEVFGDLEKLKSFNRDDKLFAVRVPEQSKERLSSFIDYYKELKNYPAAQEEYDELVTQLSQLAQHYDGDDNSPRSQVVLKSIDMAIDQAQEDIRQRVFDDNYNVMLEKSKNSDYRIIFR